MANSDTIHVLFSGAGVACTVGEMRIQLKPTPRDYTSMKLRNIEPGQRMDERLWALILAFPK